VNPAILASLREHGIDARPNRIREVGGGSISRAYHLHTSRQPLLLKVNTLEYLDGFRAEADGLAALAASSAVSVPAVLAVAGTAGHAWIAIEWLDLVAGTVDAEKRLGAGLARLHRVVAPRFGWSRDNYIGATPQPNGWRSDWVGFLRERRLGHQLELAARRHLPRALHSRAVRLLERLELFYQDYVPAPSLLHGDLWAGNWGADRSGQPWLFDPAVHFGDREADIAMTRLFGGFGTSFYRAYEQEWPLDTGAQQRLPLHQLYHLLNHFNLFGSAYLPQVSGTLDRLDATA
jgi:protein-ribulosamine 3-kinase